MKDDNKSSDSERQETLLIALDQLSQTIDVMNSVVGRLRRQLERQACSPEAEHRRAMRSDRVLH